MKQLVILITFLLLYSCHFDNKSTNKTRLSEDSLEKIKSDSVIKKLSGEWGIYSTNTTTITTVGNKKLETNSSTLCNVCPKVIFDSTRLGTVIKSSSDKESIKWEVTGNKLKIIYINNSLDKTFPDSVYEMNFTQEKTIAELNLVQLEKKYSLTLRR